MNNVLNFFEQPGIDNDNKFVVNGTMIVDGDTISATKLANVVASNDGLVVSTNRALLVSGYNVINGGTGLAGLTLAAPQEGARCEISVATLTSGTVVVTAAPGTTFDGTNNTATFNAIGDRLDLVYFSPTQWLIVRNNSVTLSLV
jgi:hypothetical protein